MISHCLFDDVPRIEACAADNLKELEMLDLSTPISFSSQTAPLSGTEEWKVFLQSILLADWACYDTPASRVEYKRLHEVISAFPQGFTLYEARYANGLSYPVGYTGWYPVEERIFKTAIESPQATTSRGFFKALSGLAGHGNWIYLFNYSIAPALRRTRYSRLLMQNYAAELKAVPHNKKGMLAVTVSADGERVAQKFGLSERGCMTHDGVPEKVYASFL